MDEHHIPSPVVTLYTTTCNIQKLRASQSTFMYLAWISGQVKIMALNSNNFPAQMDCVCCAVQIEYLNVIQVG